MLAVARPQLQAPNRSRRRNERVSQFYVMALRILPKIGSCAGPNLGVNRHAIQRSEKRVQSSIFVRQSAVPQFRDGDWGERNNYLSLSQLVPSHEQSVISCARDLD